MRIILRAPIRFDGEDGKPSHAPMVLATVGAIHTRLILDTGSDVHLLTRELADAAGLDLSTVDTGTDHSGSTLDSWLVGDVAVAIDEADPAGESLALHDVVAIPAPAAFLEKGIGGILSPQRLHPTAFAVIDQVADELALLDGDAAAVRAWLDERYRTPQVLELARRPGDDRPIVEAAIEPFPPVPVLVNTGGRHTEFEPGSVRGLAAGDLARIGTGVSGGAVMGASAGRQVARLGPARVEIPALMLRTGMDDPRAMIGQDVLRGTVVAVGPDTSAPVFWQVATLESAPRDAPPGHWSRPQGE